MSQVTPSIPAKKKRKSGGSFCAEATCSNNSQRQKTSNIPGRGFLRFYKLPKNEVRRIQWVSRMKRQFGWKPSNYTKICSDHFHDNDFEPGDLMKFRDNPNLPNLKLRLKQDAIPCTDRNTGQYIDPLISPSTPKRPVPRMRNQELEQDTPEYSVDDAGSKMTQSDCGTDEFFDVEQDFINDFLAEDDGFDCEDESPEYDPVDSEDDAGFTDSDFSDDYLEEDEEIVYQDKNAITSKFQWAFVSIPLLLSLFDLCPKCGSHCNIINVRTKGFALTVEYKCRGILPHHEIWRNSPFTKRYFDINLMLPAMATMCGLGYTLLENLMIGLKIPYIASTSYYNNIKVNLYPVVVAKWTAMRDNLIQCLMSEETCDVAGDGHFDSPGWTAKFCTYSIMDMASGAIIDFFVSQRAMYEGDLEMESCKEVLSNLTEKGLKIRNFVTDENSKVSKMVRDNFKSLVHCLDVWHKARLLKKKLQKLATTHTELLKFVPKIVNHFWYSCQTCTKDPQVLLETFHGCLLHICNKHAWTEDPFSQLKGSIETEKEKHRKKKRTDAEKKRQGPGLPYFTKVRKCSHSSRMRHRRLRGTHWLDMDGGAFKTLFKFLTDTRFCNSIKKCNEFLHTGGLEVYHNVRLKLLPKRSSYKLVRMIVSGMLVAIDVNSNLESNTNLKRKRYWKWSRSQKQYVAKQRILKKDYSFRVEIMNNMMSNLKNNIESIPIQDILTGYYIKRDIPARIVPVDFPSCEPNFRSRF